MTTAFGTGVTGPDGRSLDQVQLTGVSARGYHGVLPSERQIGPGVPGRRRAVPGHAPGCRRRRPGTDGELCGRGERCPRHPDGRARRPRRDGGRADRCRGAGPAAGRGGGRSRAQAARAHPGAVRRRRGGDPPGPCPHARRGRSGRAGPLGRGLGSAAGADALRQAHDALRQSQDPSEGLAYEPSSQDTFPDRARPPTRGTTPPSTRAAGPTPRRSPPSPSRRTSSRWPGRRPHEPERSSRSRTSPRRTSPRRPSRPRSGLTRSRPARSKRGRSRRSRSSSGSRPRWRPSRSRPSRRPSRCRCPSSSRPSRSR